MDKLFLRFPLYSLIAFPLELLTQHTCEEITLKHTLSVQMSRGLNILCRCSKCVYTLLMCVVHVVSLCARMQDGSCDQTLRVPLAPKERGADGVAAELYLDSPAETGEDGPEDEDAFPELSTFLSQEEMDRSLDLAWEAFSSAGDEEAPSPEAEPPAPPPGEDPAPRPEAPGDAPGPRSPSGERFASPRPSVPLYKQERPRLLHEPPELSDRGSTSEFCSRAATFIEELSSIFRGSARAGQQADEDSSSPDSGYLSPRVPAARTAPALQETSGAGTEPEAPPRFTQKLKSQEVSEGSPIRLECRVTGNPRPVVRWFCEGRELHHCPDIQISRDRDLHALVIAEAFEDDTGRYTCVASNCLGADNTSAEVYIEGASGKGVAHRRDAAVKRLSGVSGSSLIAALTKRAESRSVSVSAFVHMSGVTRTPQSLSHTHTHTHTLAEAACPKPNPLLQDARAHEGQVVVLECRVRGTPPLQVHWFREGQQIQDSPDFRILQKKPRSAAEPEEICTLVIAETFPEDGGLFTCTATNRFGSSSSAAQLTIQPANGVSADEGASFPPPPPPPPAEIGLPEAPPTPPGAQRLHVNELEMWPSVAALQPVQIIPSQTQVRETPGRWALADPPPDEAPPPKNDPPLPTRPKPKLKMSRGPRIASDSEIQGSKDAVIQDLERKLRFKEERLSNGQQKLTYEEKMARRLLGANSAATVFNVQEAEEEPATQVRPSPLDTPTRKEYKVSSFEQRLISEIEFRLERSPVEESDDDTTHDDDAPGQRVAPFFDQKLRHFKVYEGMPVTFTCKVIGDPRPKVYWFKDGKQISKRSEHYRMSREADGTCSLHTAAALLDDDGNYTIMASNPEGRTSCTGRMMVQAVNQRGRSSRATPGHIRRPRSRSRDSGEDNDNIQERHFRPHFLQAPGDLIVQEGKLCRMDCKVSGLPTPDLVWQLNGQTIRPDSAHKMLVRENGVHSLVIEPVTSWDAGVYTCIASNRAGQNSFSLELIVAAKEIHEAPAFVEKLQNTSVADGYPVRLECRVSGVPHPQIFWKKENESLTHNTERISMHQDNHGYICMLIQPATKEDAGWYTVSAKNEAGIVSSTARLDVHSEYAALLCACACARRVPS
uniref:Palladin n=1 Tax=Scleropages formosus TaxID=113540 RepID=A0A8C9S1D9_SCLFO